LVLDDETTVRQYLAQAWQDENKTLEVRLWASFRGQTLARTVNGMLQGEAALLMLSQQESDPTAEQSLEQLQEHAVPRGHVWHDDDSWIRQAHMKYQYVVTCQVYGKWSKDAPKTDGTEGGKEKQEAVDKLMQIFPHFRVAYVDGPVGDAKEFFSVLLRWCAQRQKVVECYRVKLPGGILVGEGKPNNQNHAIIFTRGEFLQTIDMNQDGYFEEALKIRNLLEEFAGSPDPQAEDCCSGLKSCVAGSCSACFEHIESETDRVQIVGFPEHQFSENLSAVAEFAALTEFTFTTLIQRTLASPFDVRMHYGHPDIFDKTFHISRGGISKASKTLNVSEVCLPTKPAHATRACKPSN
jgi:callose synthase